MKRSERVFMPPLCTYSLNPGEPPEDGEMNEMTLPLGFEIRALAV